MAKQTKKQAVEQRTQQRLAARQQAAQRGVETRRRNREAREQAQVAPQAAEAQEQKPAVAKRRTKLRERAAPATSLGTGAHDKGPSEAMATVALRGEQAVRFRALAAARGVSLARLLVQMIEAFEERAE